MEYHKDRFDDYSLLIYDDHKLIAVFPANIKEKQVYSHQGLSYGGVILKEKRISFSIHLKIYQSILKFLNSNNIETLHIKSIPDFYFKSVNQESEIIFNWLKAEVSKVDIYSVIDTSDLYNKPNRNRLRNLKTATSLPLHFYEEKNDFHQFWEQVLNKNLQNRFGVHAVHSLDEIKYLKHSFNDEIKLFLVKDQKSILAGAVLFIFDDVVHFQYSAGIEDRSNGALDFLFIEIVEKYSQMKFISFGSSMVSKNQISKGLLYWKESLGARNSVQKFYTLQTKNFQLLDNRII